MSIKKPLLKITVGCGYCLGLGCVRCYGTGRATIRNNNKEFKKYYIEALNEAIDHSTAMYRIKHKEAQNYLKKVRKYSKELDKVVNK